MDSQPITCELVDEQELDRRYVAGRLSDEEAAAFEAHYFACDRCWALVKGGADVRAALAGEGTARAVRPRTWLKPLALAAGLTLVMIGTWRFTGSTGSTTPDAIRGAGDSIAVQSVISAGRWQARWPSVSESVVYRVRIFGGDGRLLLTRETSDTVVSLTTDSLSALGRGGPLYLEVERLDALRRPVGRSPLVPLR
jgi:anti-sigma factor RsiW